MIILKLNNLVDMKRYSILTRYETYTNIYEKYQYITPINVIRCYTYMFQNSTTLFSFLYMLSLSCKIQTPVNISLFQHGGSKFLLPTWSSFF